MSLLRRLLSDRWRDSSGAKVFEGPFGPDKRTSLTVDDAAARLAAIHGLLVGRGIGEGMRIGVLSNHRIETYLAVLGTVSTGATFVPLNPKFPIERLRAILGLASPALVLGDVSSRVVYDELGADIEFVDIADVDPDSTVADEWHDAVDAGTVGTEATAYVMFTSGSTGTPKGVPISFGNLVAYVDGVTELLRIPEGSRFSQFFDLSFDLSMHDIFVSTRAMGTLVAPSQVDVMMPGAYASREKIDAWFSVPLLGAQLGSGARKPEFGGFRSMLFCGEALPMETVIACRPWLANGGRMWNLYGPTEATIAFTAADVTDSTRHEGNASIGRAFGRNITALLGPSGEVVTNPEVGAEGELLLGGPQVFAGYSTDAPSPFVTGGSMPFYRSGDLVRLDSDGVYFRGRVDSQVKFRGYRIELGEIETVARRTFGLKTLAVVVAGEGGGAKLVMYFLDSERSDDEPLDPKALADTLPAYMIPAELIGLERMPTNQNGKIDRRALSALAQGG